MTSTTNIVTSNITFIFDIKDFNNLTGPGTLRWNDLLAPAMLVLVSICRLDDLCGDTAGATRTAVIDCLITTDAAV